MFKFFRRSRADKCDRLDSDNNAGNAKKSISTKENVKAPKLSATLENSLLSRGLPRASASSNNDKNKVLRGRHEDHHDPPQLQANRGGNRKLSHLQKTAGPLPVANDAQSRENTKTNCYSPSYAKEKSSRNEIVDLTRGDRTSQYRTQNDRSRSRLIDKNASTHDNRLHLLQRQNQCQKNQQQQQHPQTPPKRSDQAPIAPNSFNPINKSREFFYEIMGKNRNRNRNRNRNKDSKPYNRDNVSNTSSSVGREPGDQQNKSNELVAQMQDQLTKQQQECDKMPNQTEGISGGDLSATVDSNISNENIDKFVKENENKDEENFENFGYQITKSKNSENLVMNYEGEDQDDREKQIEGNTISESHVEAQPDRGDPTEDSQADDVSQPQCADAPSDVNGDQGENRFSDGNEESYQSSNNFDNTSNNSNSNATDSANETHKEENSIVIGDLNVQHVERSESRNENDPQHFDADEDQSGRQQDTPDAALASSTQDDAPVQSEWHSLKNFEDDRNSIDGQLQIDQDDLEEQQTSAPISTSLIDCDCDNQQPRQELDDANMGQDNSKSASDRHRRSSADQVHSNIVIPTITVADYSDARGATKDYVTNDSAGLAPDNEVFYDTEAFDIDSCNNQSVEDCDNDSNLQFVACESSDDRVIIEDDPEDPEVNYGGACNNFSDIPTTVIDTSDTPNNDSSPDNNNIYHSDTGDNINLSNTSSSSTINDSKNSDSPDSGIELLDESHHNQSSTGGENFLHINRDSELFVRGGSTDCDESFLFPSDNEDHDYQQQHHHQQTYHQSDFDSDSKDKPILIDSISLPDVVVESTAGGSSGIGMGNSHSVKPVDHVEDHNKHHSATIIVTDHNDNETRDLVNQEARYSAQLEEAQKIILSAQTKVNDLQAKIDSLEKELSIKSWNVDRLQGELQAANKEDACVRRRLNLLQDEIVDIKQKYSENEYELNRRYDELKTKHTELLDNYRHTQNLANALQTQLAFAQSDIETVRKEKQKLCEEKDAELRNLQEALKESQEKHKELEIKWQKEFESLRTQNADREEHLMADCEWKLRTMQRTCKDKVEAAKKEKNEALEKANEISTRATEQIERVTHLIPLEAEIKQLRGLTNDQRESMSSMSEQMTELRDDLEAANKRLEEEIENVRKIRLHCDNALSDKDRQMIQKIEEARGTVAVEWETRLLEEMTRLKHELEMVHAEERREALDKLQAEHIEEIKVLTCRYGANEEELQMEVAKLRQTLQEKCDEFKALKEQTDAALLETRLHLERADSEYQIAFNREIDKREQLAEQLKAEFAKEKSEMEEKFRERLNQVKDEFAKELANATDAMQLKHRKQLEQQWEKLIAEKEEALQTMESRHRIRLDEAASRINTSADAATATTSTTSHLAESDRSKLDSSTSVLFRHNNMKLWKGACPLIPTVLIYYFSQSFPLALICLLLICAFRFYI
ncbi:putative uncharacterized protein DDB_G0282133 isoform X4 [Hermetia illucens]|uniref:putative uncharacterized protein DDB_G0282133 isoform X4 n=1 Tax=Hermetia illucens TaxID=343691 RepID=UPI0018CC1DF0|nr:putative uncharacterized protein DDB_G0282133 isoform X4 [Hermetia illucens]